MIETGRLRLYPATRQQMEASIAAETCSELKKAYSEMLAGCLQDPVHWDWYAMWRIEKPDGTPVGDLCFKGPGTDGAVEIGYGILDACQGQGYATEAVRAALDWAFRHPELCAVEAEAEAGNRASLRVLEKCGFLAKGEIGEEGPRFSLSRERYETLNGDTRGGRGELPGPCGG